MSKKPIRSALISVFHKEGLLPIAKKLHQLNVTIYSTGGTQRFLEDAEIPVIPVEEMTQYPSIFGGRVKTLHPAIFGGILHRRDHEQDLAEKAQHEIPDIDLVIVDLYPFEETVASGAGEQEIIEKIDIGGISLIRATAKNFKDTLIVSSRDQYEGFLGLLENGGGTTELAERRKYATQAFDISSHYDVAIFNYFNEALEEPSMKVSIRGKKTLRYGENPHQEGAFFGDLESQFEQLHGKDVSYNNLIDIEAAIQLISEFPEKTAFGILKHNNACGFAQGDDLKTAYLKAFEADTLSAFGGILVTNRVIDEETAMEMDKLFFEIAIAPGFDEKAMSILQRKKNRILLVQKPGHASKWQYRSMLGGVIAQEQDLKTDAEEDLKTVTKKGPTADEIADLLCCSKLCKHSKSNTIVLVKNGQMLASGVGQTSRVDALNQAIEKAKRFGFSLEGAVMASDAFFPFPDCVEIAHKAGITAVIQPGGSIKDQDSIDFCDAHHMAMVFTGFRHFKH